MRHLIPTLLDVCLLLVHYSNDLELVYLTIVLQEFVGDLSKIDAPKFGFKFNDPKHPLEYFYTPTVDADLPVLLSDKVVDLIGAYAPVPTATFEPRVTEGDNKTPVNGVQRGKFRLETPKVTPEHKELLKEVTTDAKADEYGCLIQ